jgi:hypothetical protein
MPARASFVSLVCSQAQRNLRSPEPVLRRPIPCPVPPRALEGRPGPTPAPEQGAGRAGRKVCSREMPGSQQLGTPSRSWAKGSMRARRGPAPTAPSQARPGRHTSRAPNSAQRPQVCGPRHAPARPRLPRHGPPAEAGGQRRGSQGGVRAAPAQAPLFLSDFPPPAAGRTLPARADPADPGAASLPAAKPSPPPARPQHDDPRGSSGDDDDEDDEDDPLPARSARLLRALPLLPRSSPTAPCRRPGAGPDRHARGGGRHPPGGAPAPPPSPAAGPWHAHALRQPVPERAASGPPRGPRVERRTRPQPGPARARGGAG